MEWVVCACLIVPINHVYHIFNYRLYCIFNIFSFSSEIDRQMDSEYFHRQGLKAVRNFDVPRDDGWLSGTSCGRR